MKRLTAIVLGMMIACSALWAQDATKKLTLYRDFKPATILLTNGQVTRIALANVFLKNAALLYKRGDNTMEAYMRTIKSVKIGEEWFVNIDNKLAQLIDSVGQNRLYCITELDLDAYSAILRNNRNITANSFQDMVDGGDQLSYSTIDLEAPEDVLLPIIRHYYFLYNGELVKAHEREISRKLPKAKRHIYKSVMSLSDFSWVDADCLLKMLKAISE